MSFTFFQSSNLFRRNFTQVTQLSTISLTHVCHKFYRFRFICKNCVNYTAVEGGVAPELHQLHLHVTPTWVHLHHSFWHNSRTWRTHTTWRPRPHLHSIARQKKRNAQNLRPYQCPEAEDIFRELQWWMASWKWSMHAVHHEWCPSAVAAPNDCWRSAVFREGCERHHHPQAALLHPCIVHIEAHNMKLSCCLRSRVLQY